MRLVLRLLIGAALTACGAVLGAAAMYCGLWAIYEFVGPFSMDWWYSINMVTLVFSGVAAGWWYGRRCTRCPPPRERMGGCSSSASAGGCGGNCA